jgi:hypothetical protein
VTTGTIHPLKSGGVLIELEDHDFPIWRADAGAARSYLLDRDLRAAHLNNPTVSPSRSANEENA